MYIPSALLEYEDRLRTLGAPVVQRLRPGLSDAELDAIAAEHNFPLPPIARFLWGWHDGADDTPPTAWNTSLVPYGTFPDLHSALATSRRWHETLDFLDDEDLDPDFGWSPHWLVVIDAQFPTVLDCTHPTRTESTPALRYASDGGVMDGFRLHFLRWVQLWTHAIDHGVWTITDDGTWAVDRDLLGPSPVALAML